MCGIAGYFGTLPQPPGVARAMLDALRPRGPDRQHAQHWDAQWQSDSQHSTHALLHTRLAVMDPRPCADQPMSSDDGMIWLCYNGEVYGWTADAQHLAQQGALFRTHSDTEFILRGYEAWGIDGLLPKLRGMFSLAIVDRRVGKVWLIRDRMGLKPMVYAHLDGRLAFGSTVRSVLPWLPQNARAFRPASIDAYLAHRYIPAPHTIFHAISRLENSHLLEYDLTTGALSKRRYWYATPTPHDWTSRLDEAILLRTVADRPLGVFLSGGIDSSTIAARLSAQGLSHLHTFSATFPGTAFDEGTQAAEIAQTLGLSNLALPIPCRIEADFERIIADLDEPFADPSSFPTWYLARETVHHVTVVLGGDGGDELLAGYKRHARHVASHWRAGITLPSPTYAHWHSKGWRKLLSELSMPWEDAYSLRFSGCTPNQRAFLEPDFTPTQRLYWRAPDQAANSPLERLLALDLANSLPEYILRKADLCTMAHGLELRAPLLDHPLYETLLALPSAQRFSPRPKQLLSDAAPALAALKLLERKKRGFNPPLDGWLRHDLCARLDGLGERLAQLTQGQLDPTRIDTLVQHYQAGQPLAEQVLQLLILDTSLRQLNALTQQDDYA